MSDIQPTLKINELPETFEVLPTDEIYVFQDKTNTFTKLEIPIGALSVYFHGKDAEARLKVKMAELAKLSTDFRNWLYDNYPTMAYISANYSTTEYFESIFNKLKSESALPTYLTEYATKDYGQYKLAEAKAQHEELKFSNALAHNTLLIRDITKR